MVKSDTDTNRPQWPHIAQSNPVRFPIESAVAVEVFARIKSAVLILVFTSSVEGGAIHGRPARLAIQNAVSVSVFTRIHDAISVDIFIRR